jgi:PhoH-like ATPase
MLPVVLADSGTAEKIFVLDTNVLMHDPSALFRFQEHHAYLPMTALEELDNAKLGVSEVARNVRHVEHSGIHTLHIRSRPSPIDALVICNIFSFIWRAKIA